MQVISSTAAPAAIGNYSPAIQVGNMLYISGQIPLNPSSQILISEDINAQIKQVFENIRALCLAAGGNLSDVVKLAVYLMDLTDDARFFCSAISSQNYDSSC